MTTEAQIEGLCEFGRRGFTLDYLGDHIWELRHEGKSVTFFEGGNLPTNVPEEYLQELCARHLIKCHGWNGYLWSRKEYL